MVKEEEEEEALGIIGDRTRHARRTMPVVAERHFRMAASRGPLSRAGARACVCHGDGVLPRDEDAPPLCAV